MKIEKDEFGWSFDLPCASCGKDTCLGRLSLWLPNKIGNHEDGLTEEEAIKEAKDLSKIRSNRCNKNGKPNHDR